MSTAAPQAPGTAQRQEIKIVSHCTLFYWWPVWALGFVLAGLTYFDGNRMAIVPAGTKVYHGANVKAAEAEGKNVDFPNSDVLVLPATPPGKHRPDLEEPYLRAAANKSYGVLFIIVVLLIIVNTNVPLRGLWSVVVIVAVVLLSVIFYLAGWWEKIFEALFRLHIIINAAGYLVLSLALFVTWLVTVALFDSQVYMIFTPGQLRVHQEIGGGEIAYDTTGMVIQKQRNDLFRHWVLGLGSGDLIVSTSGATVHHFDLPNVLFIGYKVKQIEDMLREKAVVRGQG
jgi:hypothetical protein